jgi:hypothetical protein
MERFHGVTGRFRRKKKVAAAVAPEPEVAFRQGD